MPSPCHRECADLQCLSVAERQKLSEPWSNLTVRSLTVPLPDITSDYTSVCQFSEGLSHAAVRRSCWDNSIKIILVIITGCWLLTTLFRNYYITLLEKELHCKLVKIYFDKMTFSMDMDIKISKRGFCVLYLD